MNAARPYNTGLKRGDYSALRAELMVTSHAASARGAVFAHAVERPLTADQVAVIERCGCIYCELPWPQGWPVFHERAEVAPVGSYADYVGAVRGLLGRFKKPAFIVCAKSAAMVLAQYPIQPIDLNGGRAWLAASYVEEVPDARTTEALLAWLGGRYPSVYDFGCGYGNALHGFGFFVGSDIDGKCLDYISRTLL